MPKVYQRASARRDLIEQFVYLAQYAGLETADRFLVNVQASFNELAVQPYIGVALKLRRPELAGMRKWQVKGFDNHLNFYQPRPDGVSVSCSTSLIRLTLQSCPAF